MKTKTIRQMFVQERILSSYDYDCRERMVIPKQWRNDSSLGKSHNLLKNLCSVLNN